MDEKQNHAGNLKGKKNGTKVWHSRFKEPKIYWCGSWHERTYKELYKECQTIMKDLEKNHPDIKRGQN
jgi:hypothetical protein